MAKYNPVIGLTGFATLGVGNRERQKEDFYATPPFATRQLLKLETFQKHIMEPMCGLGHIAEVLKEKGHKVKAYDLIDRGYGEQKDFLHRKSLNPKYDIISNPPYKNGELYVEKCLSLLTSKKQKVALLLRLLFLEGKTRRKLFRDYPPIRVWVSSGRLSCAKNGEFHKQHSAAMSFAWFIWGYGYKGKTELDWFN